MSIYDIGQLVLSFDNCQVFECADDNDVQNETSAFAEFDKDFLPQDYINFLTDISNGFVFNGIYLFGLKEQKLTNGLSSIPSLYQINKDFADFDCYKNRIIIGMFFSYILLYNLYDDCFEIVNNFTFLPIDSYSDFESLFYSLIDRRAE